MRPVALLTLVVAVAACGADGAGTMSDMMAGGPDGGAGPATAPLGSTAVDGGTWFRVWAPHASAVAVEGDFDAWDPTQSPMTAAGDGTFAAFVAGAGVGAQYAYAITDGNTVVRADPRARRVVSVGAQKGYVVDETPLSDDFVPAPPSASVLYELHVGTFNVDAGSQPPSNFAHVAQKMDYLASLGITHIELMPPAEFPESHSWGYNPALPFATSTVYGTPDDLRALVAAAHGRGIGVVIDVVHNHYGPKLPTLWCFDGDCLGKNLGGIYFYGDGRITTPWGPRPDYGRPEVRQFIVDNALLWLGEYGCDGLRWDSTENIRFDGSGNALPDGWKTLALANDAARAARPHALLVAEDFHDDGTVTSPTSSGGAGFDAQWDGAFFHPVDDNVILSDDTQRSMPAIADAIAHRIGGRALSRVVYTESHDEVANGKARIPSMIDPSDPGSLAARKRSTLGAAIALTTPGIPMLFMGQEFLTDGSFADTNPLDWSKATTYAPILSLYKDLIALRTNKSGTTKGLTGEGVNVFHVNDGAKVIAYHRWSSGGPGDDVIVVASFTAKPFPVYNVGLPRGGVWRVRFHADAKQYSPDFGDTPEPDVTATDTPQDGFPQRGTVALGAYDVVILSQDP